MLSIISTEIFTVTDRTFFPVAILGSIIFKTWKPLDSSRIFLMIEYGLPWTSVLGMVLLRQGQLIRRLYQCLKIIVGPLRC
jgi:hypothetical protein